MGQLISTTKNTRSGTALYASEKAISIWIFQFQGLIIIYMCGWIKNGINTSMVQLLGCFTFQLACVNLHCSNVLSNTLVYVRVQAHAYQVHGDLVAFLRTSNPTRLWWLENSVRLIYWFHCISLVSRQKQSELDALTACVSGFRAVRFVDNVAHDGRLILASRKSMAI